MVPLEQQCYRFLSHAGCIATFHFELNNLRFKAIAFKEISFLTETTSIHFLSGAIQHGRRSQNMFYINGS